MQTYPPTYFARHTSALDVEEETIARLWTERRIAVHYPEQIDGIRGAEDNPSTDPADHAVKTHGRQVMRALRELADGGGYVCAQYRGYEACLVGRVAPHTPIEPLPVTWRHASYPEGRPAALKTVRLSAVREIGCVAGAALLAGAPRRGTFTRWPNARDVVAALVEGHALAPALHRLSTAQQEVMCSEFLRTDAVAAFGLPRLAQLLLPVGRTLRDLDIFGLAADGRTLCAQVTMSSLADVAWKAARLRAYAHDAPDRPATGGGGPVPPGAHLLLFCNTGTADVVALDGAVRAVSIAAVFDRVAASAWGAAWLAGALGPVGVPGSA